MEYSLISLSLILQIGYKLIAPSWVGPLRDTLSEKTGMLVAYFTGASGNLNPKSYIEELNITKDYWEQGDALRVLGEEWGLAVEILCDYGGRERVAVLSRR